MKFTRHILLSSLLMLLFLSGIAQAFLHEQYRPQYHFTPAIHWTNDPNGLVYKDGEYHLFYQFNPFGIRWGHMTWGHAISRDLLHWEHLPVAITEEKDTMIFSGSCVVDVANTTGFAKEGGQSPMVAVYTAHVDGRSQTQHLAYSTDNGRTWTKYDHNPVLDLGKKDFRDPAVFWYETDRKWVMTVAWPQERKLQLYSSPDLKKWKLMSEFGPAGDTSGIWECPGLLQVPIVGEPGKMKWLLMHSPAPLMQYFVGEFDGNSFVNENPRDRIYRPDYGPDYYAAITFNNLPADKGAISIGWANNWNYANDIPTSPWRSAMSLPRQLAVKKINGEWILVQQPVAAINSLRGATNSFNNILVNGVSPVPFKGQTIEVQLNFSAIAGMTGGIRIAKMGDHYVEIGYDADRQMLYLDRSLAHGNDFNAAFAKMSRFEASLPLSDGEVSLHILFDKSIIEVFANDGERVITAQVFTPDADQGMELFSNKSMRVESIRTWTLKSVW